jgi:hypothetical protein
MMPALTAPARNSLLFIATLSGQLYAKKKQGTGNWEQGIEKLRFLD